MIPYLFSCGRIAFNLYGFCIAIGVIVFLWAMEHDPRTARYITRDQLTKLALWSIAIGVIGGRLFYYMNYYHEFEAWYEIFDIASGYSLLGSVLALIAFIPLYLTYYRLTWLPILDLVGTYAPLMQSIARIGCFCAGCCHGYPTHVPWAITYTHPDSYAILGVPCHPTQLYSSFSLLLLFLLLRFVIRYIAIKPGQLFAAYLIGSSAERFFNDFWRAEHYDQARLIWGMLSVDQLVAAAIFLVGVLFLCWTSVRRVRADVS